MTSAPAKLTKADSGYWTVWEKLAEGPRKLIIPVGFNSCLAQSYLASFTVTLENSAFADQMTHFSGNEPDTGGLVTFKDSNWVMSIVLAINLFPRSSLPTSGC
jgi:oleate hydratase